MFVPSKGITSKVTAWRCFQHIFRSHKSPSTTTVFFYSTLSHRWASRSSILGPKPITWRSSCLFHEKPESKKAKNDHKGLSLTALFQAPKPALFLGFAGLIPFLSAPILMATTNSFYPEIAYAQMVYGASIVSFLGGARWGFSLPDGSPALPDWKNLGNSVVPSLVAWMALLCRNNIAEGTFIVIMGLGLSLYYDLILLPGYPAWFKAQRIILTLVATLSLVATLALKNICPEKNLQKTM